MAGDESLERDSVHISPRRSDHLWTEMREVQGCRGFSARNWPDELFTLSDEWRRAKAGILDRVFARSQHAQIIRITLEVLALDSTTVKVHPAGTGVLKNVPQAIGKSRGGWTTKIHLVAAHARTAIAFCLSPGRLPASAGEVDGQIHRNGPPGQIAGQRLRPGAGQRRIRAPVKGHPHQPVQAHRAGQRPPRRLDNPDTHGRHAVVFRGAGGKSSRATPRSAASLTRLIHCKKVVIDPKDRHLGSAEE